jgi:hypothetical protein
VKAGCRVSIKAEKRRSCMMVCISPS